MHKKIISYILPFLFIIFASFLLYMVIKTHSQSWFFKDETEHVTLGWMITDYGKELYSDLSTNHQPFPILVGAFLTKFISYTSLFQLIERTRLFMFVLYVLGAVYLTYRFRWQGAVSSVFIFSHSYFFFGWHVLAESLVWPFIIYVVLAVLESYFTDKKISYTDVGIFSFSIFFTAFSLLALWPSLFILFLLYFLKLNNKQKRFFIFISLVEIGGLFLYIPFLDWYRETIENIYLYFLPDVHNSALNTLKMFLYPLRSFFQPESALAQTLIFQVVVLMMGCILFLKTQKKNNYLIFFLILVSVLLMNNRVIEIPSYFYHGFHLFPFLAGFSALSSFFGVQIFKQNKPLCLVLK